MTGNNLDWGLYRSLGDPHPQCLQLLWWVIGWNTDEVKEGEDRGVCDTGTVHRQEPLDVRPTVQETLGVSGLLYDVQGRLHEDREEHFVE